VIHDERNALTMHVRSLCEYKIIFVFAILENWAHRAGKITRIDGSQVSFLVVLEPSNVITLAGDVIALQGRLEHGQIGLATGRRESSADVTPLRFRLPWVLETHDQHVLGKPAFPLSKG